MDSISRGQLVRVTAGKEKGEIMAVLDSDGGRVLLSDGRGRPIEKPKCKNAKHLILIPIKLEEKTLIANRELRRAINRAADMLTDI